MKTYRYLGVALMAMLLSFAFAACGDDDDEGVAASIAGKWNCTNKAKDTPYWVFNSNGTGYAIDTYGEKEPFSYKLGVGKITVAWDDDWEDPDVWTVVISDNTMTFYYTDSGEVDWAFKKDAEEDSEDKASENNKGVKAVDLGLSVKWASCNVGASTPEEYGEYYAWGETSEKSNYDWENYKYCKGTMTTCYHIGDDISGTSYDVAHIKWGDGWRMPTDAEFEELSYKCAWTWTTQNGVKGYIVKGSNGNSIFLPAAGSYNGSKVHDSGERGRYWSGTLFKQLDYEYAQHIQFYSRERGYTGYWARCMGLTVRPVKE